MQNIRPTKKSTIADSVRVLTTVGISPSGGGGGGSGSSASGLGEAAHEVMHLPCNVAPSGSLSDFVDALPSKRTAAPAADVCRHPSISTRPKWGCCCCWAWRRAEGGQEEVRQWQGQEAAGGARGRG